MEKADKTKKHSRKTNDSSTSDISSGIDFMLKIDFEQVSEVSNEIVKCKKAILKLRELAQKIVHSKEQNIEVSVSLFEEIEPKKDIHGKNNVVDMPIFMISTPEDLGKLAMYSQSKEERDNYKRSTIREDKMPPEIALIMFESMKKHYQNRLILLFEQFVNEVDK